MYLSFFNNLFKYFIREFFIFGVVYREFLESYNRISNFKFELLYLIAGISSSSYILIKLILFVKFVLSDGTFRLLDGDKITALVSVVLCFESSFVVAKALA